MKRYNSIKFNLNIDMYFEYQFILYDYILIIP